MLHFQRWGITLATPHLRRVEMQRTSSPWGNSWITTGLFLRYISVSCFHNIRCVMLVQAVRKLDMSKHNQSQLPTVLFLPLNSLIKGGKLWALLIEINPERIPNNSSVTCCKRSLMRRTLWLMVRALPDPCTAIGSENNELGNWLGISGSTPALVICQYVFIFYWWLSSSSA